MIHELHQRFWDSGTIGIAFLYCKFNDKWTIVDLLGSLLRQLLQKQQPIPDDLKRTYDDYKQTGHRPSSDDILKFLDLTIAHLSKSIVIIDALDECLLASDSPEERTQLLSGILSLQAKHNISVLITSRENPDISTILEGKPCLPIHANVDDIQIFLRSRIGILPKCVLRDAALQNEIVSEISYMVDGM